MPRTLSTAFRKKIEMRDSPALLLCFAVITHPDLAADIRIVSEDVQGYSRSPDGNIINYNLSSLLYTTLPFYFDLVTDSDRPPISRIAIPDVAHSINLSILDALSAPVLSFAVYQSSDWGTTLDGSNARSPTGTPERLYYSPFLKMQNFTSDQAIIQSDLKSFDFTGEPWPYHRVTKDTVPGAYW
jgi:hypothetical protein